MTLPWLTATALPESFKPTDDSVGPTCAYYLGMGSLPFNVPIEVEMIAEVE